jgi:hypothetical protein
LLALLDVQFSAAGRDVIAPSGVLSRAFGTDVGSSFGSKTAFTPRKALNQRV